ncbi:hypothetical protein GH5_06603 [Leishmania sp. Ghana 2012 LV757]|uniref:hypothetical protein n=1 Tax=Leishmania sp. Ghana 2012 LV757 TaxID=2803181 RepID=UPI001B3DE0DC|nr:hypothetical protein GH5_06603 [Leishmania sp. Ghana 2012 LV757]
MQVDLRRRGLQSFDPAEFANTDEHLHILLQVRQLDLSYNSLYTITGLEGLTHLTVLNISHNGLRSLSGGLPLTLRELDASHNSLASLQNAALLPLKFLTTLNVSFNDLEDLRGVPNVTAQLTYLDVRSNRLTSLMGIEHCSQLRTLHAEANLLREIADVASIKCLSLLCAVFLSGNPLLLRKRLLTKLHHLLPSSVEEDDLPTTAPPSSIRSSTAAPPSVPDTSSVASLDNSTVASVSGYRQEVRCGSGQSSRPASAHQGAALSTRDTTDISGSSAILERTALLHANSSTSQSHRHLPYRGACDRAHPLPSSAVGLSAPTVPAVATGVVGGASDSPTCPRRPLPHEHRLAEIPGSVSASSSPGTAHASVSFGPLHSSNGQGSLTGGTLPVSASLPHGCGSVVAAPRATRNGPSPSGELDCDDLQDQLARVTAERDSYRRELVVLRKEVRELRQKYARQWVQERAADLDELGQTSVRPAAAAPVHREGNVGSAQSGACHPRQEQQQWFPSERLLAVEMSAHSSVCSQDGERNTPDPSNRDLRTSSQHRDPVTQANVRLPPSASLHAPQSTATMSRSADSSKMDRRGVAALFMATLQQSSSSSH